MRKVFIESSNSSYERMWQDFGYARVAAPTEADVIQFTGGEDVDPVFYDEQKHPTTHSNRERDFRCFRLFETATNKHIPMAGICRGGQFLNVANGGKMFQDVDHHAIRDTHDAVILDSGKHVQVTSTHHQMMRPNRDSGIVLMIADPHLTTYKHCMMNGQEENLQNEDDVESIYYPTTNSLCFQPHPEYCANNSECRDAYRYLLRNHLGLDID